VENISQEKAQQHHLEEQAAEMRAVIEYSPNGILVVGAEANIRSANPAACVMFAYAHEDFLNVSVHTLVPDALREQHITLFEEEVSGVSHKIVGKTREVIGKRQDGSQFPCAVTVNQFMLMGEMMFSVLVQDLTIRKQAQEHANHLLSIIETSSDFIGMASADGMVMYINPAGRKLLALREEQITPRLNVRSLHPEFEINRLLHDIFPTLEQHGMYQTELAFLSQDGEEIPTLAAFSIQKNAQAETQSYAVIAHDIRKERQQQQRIQHGQRLESLGMLAGGIAHDFNNILTAILGNAALAERKAMGQSPEFSKYLNNVVESSEKAAMLCRQMLAYSGKGKFVVKALNLSDMVEGITKLLEVSISKNIVLKYHLADPLPAVEADAAQMQQVIMNLVINASDAIGEKSGVISITTGVMHADDIYFSKTTSPVDLPEGRYVYLEVSDTGCGMDKKTQARIFDPFFTTKPTGHGLGMSAVLGIVHGHHGTLKVYSESGTGTTFKMLLPVADSDAQDIDQAMPTSETWRGQGTVLIVDDEETIRETAAMMLEDMGFKTLTAVDGLDGVESFKRHQHEISVVLLDMTMPKLDGQGCFRALRQLDEHVKVVLSSGYNEQEATSRFTGKGLAGFIQKPYHPDALEAVIQSIVTQV